MLESLFFLFLLFVVFSMGPVASMTGIYKRSSLLAFFGCVLCWIAAVLCITSVFAMVFNPVSIIPVITIAFVATMGWLVVAMDTRRTKTAI